MSKQPELDPMCLKGTIAMAITNRGELIPCCRCDDPHTIEDPEFQKLLAVSNISEYKSIEEILETSEWKKFAENLKNNVGPQACWYTCKKHKNQEDIQTVSIVDTKNKKIKHQEKR